MVAFVLPEVLNGPFHIMVNQLPDLSQTEPTTICRNYHKVHLNHQTYSITPRTLTWNPVPDWSSVSISASDVTALIDLLKIAGSRIDHIGKHAKQTFNLVLPSSLLARLSFAIRNESYPLVSNIVKDIVGRGPGLTPSGDDFLAGLMISFWAMHVPTTQTLCDRIAEAAQGRTTTLSLAFINAITSGAVDEKWHILLRAISRSNHKLLEKSIRHILGFGATSGYDMLSGFIWGIQEIRATSVNQI
jgi:hypothetical protein